LTLPNIRVLQKFAVQAGTSVFGLPFGTLKPLFEPKLQALNLRHPSKGSALFTAKVILASTILRQLF